VLLGMQATEDPACLARRQLLPAPRLPPCTSLRWAVPTPPRHLLLCRSEPCFIPAASVAQVSRWCSVLLAQLFRGCVDFGRPADIALDHLGCFQLRLPDGRSIPLTAVALHGQQQQRPQLGINALLEAFRAAGAVLVISAPKCKQCAGKRGRGPVRGLGAAAQAHPATRARRAVPHPHPGVLHGSQLVGQGGGVCEAVDRAQGAEQRQGRAETAPAARLPGDSDRLLEGGHVGRPEQLQPRPVPAAAAPAAG
jgi:hypothetical protein